MHHYRTSRDKILKPSKLPAKVGKLIHAVLTTRARYPSQFVGIEIYWKFRHLIDCLRNIKDSDVQKLMMRISNVLSELKKQYNAVSESVQIIRSICKIPHNPEDLKGRDVGRCLIAYIRPPNEKIYSIHMTIPTYLGQTTLWNPIEYFKRNIRHATEWRHSNDFCVRWGFIVFVMYPHPEAMLGLLELLA